MKTRVTLITRHTGVDKFWSRNFRTIEEAIEIGEILKNRRFERHEIIGVVKNRNNGHRWSLQLWRPENPKSMGEIVFCSKKDSIFAIKRIKEYDDTLKVKLTKIY